MKHTNIIRVLLETLFVAIVITFYSVLTFDIRLQWG